MSISSTDTIYNSVSFSEKIIAALLCKGDLSDEKEGVQPCSTSELFRYATRSQKIKMGIGIVCTALTGLLLPVSTALSGSVANEYLNTKDPVGNEEVMDAVLLIVLIYGIISIFIFVLSFIQQFLLLNTTNAIIDRFRREFLSAVLRLDSVHLNATSSGELNSQLNENIEKIRDGLADKIALIVRGCGMYIISVIISFIFNWKVTLALMPIGPISAIIMGLMGKFSAPSMNDQMDANAKTAELVQETVMNVQTVAACNGQESMVKKYATILLTVVSKGSKVCLINGFFEGIFFFALYVASIIAFIVGVTDVHSNGMEPGTVLIAVSCILLGSYFLGILGPHMMALLKARIGAAIIFQTIDKAKALDKLESEVRLFQGKVEFRDVRFKYVTRDSYLLKGLCWSAEPGQSIALVGHSGCGKSTSVGLLTRLYHHEQGSILIDGRELSEYDTITLRKNIGVVQQEPCLFNGTIRENILLGRQWTGKGTTEERMKEVATIAQARPFIDKLSDGYDTVLGDGGISLSGGQKQRIAIARAIFADPSILVLDEATSALDVQSEKLVQEALLSASAGRTTISIAHRLSTLKNVDIIYVMDDGKVVEKGSHRELLSLGGRYSIMAAKQSLGVEDDEGGIKKKRSIDDQAHAVLRRNTSIRGSSARKEKIIHEMVTVDESEVNRSNMFRAFTHGHTWKILFSVFFSFLRGWEIPLYTILMRFLYSALDAPSDDYWRELLATCGFSFFTGSYIWLVLTLAYWLAGLSSESVMARLREKILLRVLHRDSAYFDDPKTSNAVIVNDINSQPNNLIAVLDQRMILFVWTTTSLIVCLIGSIIICWKVGVIALIFSILLLSACLILFFAMTNETEKEAQISTTAELSLEIIEQTRTIQVLTVEGYFEKKYEEAQNDVKSLKWRIDLYQSLIFAITQGAIYVYGMLAFGAGAYLVYQGEVEAENLFFIGIGIELIGWCITFVVPIFPDFVKANAAARLLYPYYDLPQPIDIQDEKIELTGQFVVNNVSFAYPTRPEHRVAKGLNISATAGESIALVGPSGCGKSTLIALMERFYEQHNGVIKVDSYDHRHLSLHNLRRQVALVGQEPVLFQGTIAENILLGCNSSIEDVREACKMANAASFIENLPEGYETEVGEKGGSLSGGQKQRIAIARALIRKPKILLLDEATSALDGESEKIVQEALSVASKGRTSISIAHRLASIKGVSRIYFIEDGSVIESGNHEELIERNGRYAAYVKAQSLDDHS